MLNILSEQRLIFFILMAGISAILTYICKKFVRIIDNPTHRSSHTVAVPKSGGIAIVATFYLGICLYYLANGSAFDQKAFTGLVVSAFVIALVSFYDDLTQKAFYLKVLGQLLGVILLISFGLSFKSWNIPFLGLVSLGFTGYVLTSIWIVGFTNAFNFMDGLNGLAAGVAIIVSLTFSFITAYYSGEGFAFISYTNFLIASACTGFIIFNYPKASVFMGDVGSAFLGFSFAAMALFISRFDNISFMVIPILFANFILETLFTFIWRLFNKEPIHKAHRIHLYQLLNQMGIPAKRITLFYYGQTIILAVLSLLYLNSNSYMRSILILSLIAVYLFYFLLVHRAARRKGIIRKCAL